MQERIVLFSENARPEEKICVNESWVDHSMCPHGHDFSEIIYINNGTGIHIIDGRRYLAEQGDLFVLRNEARHSYEALTNDFSWINCTFQMPVLFQQGDHAFQEECRALLLPYCDWEEQNLENVYLHRKESVFQPLFHSMLLEYRHALSSYQEILLHYLLILFQEIHQQILVSEPYRNTLSGGTLIDIVQEWVNRSAGAPLCLEQLSSQVFFSPDYFPKLFKKKTGIPLSAFLRDTLLDRAAQLLQMTDAPLENIMVQAGYQDISYFEQLFKKKYGVSPRRYRLASRSGQKRG